MEKVNLLKDDRAQAGAIILFVLGLFIVGFLYIVLGYIEGFYVTHNNNLISGNTIPYSQDHSDTMQNIFQFWWAIPIIALIVFIIYSIKQPLLDLIGG